MSDEQQPVAGEDAMARLETALTAWDVQLRDMHEHIASQLTRAHERLDKLLDGEANGSAGLLQQRDAEIEALQTRLSEAGRAADDATARAEAAQADGSRLAVELESACTALESARAELEALKQELPRVAAERDGAVAERDAARAERDASAAECARLSQELEELRAQEFDSSPTASLEEFEELRQSVDEHARRHGAAAMERDQLREELDVLRTRHSLVCGQKQEAEAECIALRMRVRELEDAAQAAPQAPAEPARAAATPEELFTGLQGKAGVKKKLGEMLVDAGVITPQQLEDVLGKQSKTPRRRLGAMLVELGYTNEDIVARAFAAQLQMPFTTLSEDEVDPHAAALLPAKIARMHHCIPIREEEGLLSVAMANPLDLVAIEDIEIATKCLVFPLVATTAAIDFMVTRHCR